MKDSESLILYSFLFALSQQHEALPATVVAKIQEIAQSLETRVTELYDLAIATAQLTSDYQNAYRWLTSTAAERGLGLNFPPAKDEATSDKEQLNISADIGPSVTEMQRVLLAIEQRIDPQTAGQILSGANPTTAVQRQVN